METYQVLILLIVVFIAGLWIASSFPRCKHEWTLLHEKKWTITNVLTKAQRDREIVVYTCKKCGKTKQFEY